MFLHKVLSQPALQDPVRMTRFMSSRDFNQDTSRAKKETADGPVIITDRGRPAHVLLSWSDYQRLAASRQSLVEQLAHPASAHVEFEPVRDAFQWRALDLA